MMRLAPRRALETAGSPVVLLFDSAALARRRLSDSAPLAARRLDDAAAPRRASKTTGVPAVFRFQIPLRLRSGGFATRLRRDER
ncbi:MAG TPA: hypothetical protein VEI02_03140 [Planctomycetota bacterium]|nr:hypothetical protein [Planctomycetota bacterium]